MFDAWKFDKFPTISNKNYPHIFSGSGYMAKGVRQPPHFSTNFWVERPFKFSCPWLKQYISNQVLVEVIYLISFESVVTNSTGQH